MEKRFLTLREAAEILNLSRQRVAVFIQEGRLQADKINNSYMIKRIELSKLIEKRKRGITKRSTRSK